MSVYAIRCGEDGPVKLGYAADPEGRLAELQVAHYQQLRIIRLWEGGSLEEAILHARFFDLRIRGEWFSFSRAMLGDVGLSEIVHVDRSIPEPVPVVGDVLSVPLCQRIALARTAARMTQREVAAAMNVSPSAVAQWETIAKNMRTTRLIELAALLNVSVEWLLSTDIASVHRIAVHHCAAVALRQGRYTDGRFLLETCRLSAMRVGVFSGRTISQEICDERLAGRRHSRSSGSLGIWAADGGNRRAPRI